jgi:hypothetical protein
MFLERDQDLIAEEKSSRALLSEKNVYGVRAGINQVLIV